MKQKFNSIDKILITGLPRSGTTFFGNILGSCQQVEYFFEPIMINKFFSYIDKIESGVWMDIFEEYCLNELLASSVAGRRLNFNSNDDSYIFNSKTKEEIDIRLNKSWRASDLTQKLDDYTFAFKTPGISNYLGKVLSFYSNWKLVVVFRTYEDILSSILIKGWFNDQNKNIITTYRVINGMKIPTVISENWNRRWVDLNEIERAMVYMNEQLNYISDLENYVRLDYDKFVENPEILLTYFAELNVEPTEKTQDLLKTIRRKEVDNSHLLESQISSDILNTALQFKTSLKI